MVRSAEYEANVMITERAHDKRCTYIAVFVPFIEGNPFEKGFSLKLPS